MFQIKPCLKQAALSCVWMSVVSASEDPFAAWPAGGSPREVGKLVVRRFIDSPHTNYGQPTPPKEITYPEVCTWYGALTFAELTKDAELSKALEDRFEPLFNLEAHLVPNPVHVDATVFCAVPLELFRQTKEEKYRRLGLPIAEFQWKNPPEENLAKLPSDLQGWIREGLSPQTRLWIDDMYMITMVQTQAFRATGERKFADRAAREMVFYLKHLQQPNGLFHHAPDVPFFWGRGNGWMAAGMAELLRALPEDHPQRAAIMDGYRKMMKTLLAHQADTGMWRQLIDDPQSWPETSGTGMFAFAFITGVKSGWLDAAKYGPAARKAWLALSTYLEPNGDIREVCMGTNKKNDRDYYLQRPRLTGDMHGQAPVLWCASALLR